MSRSKQPLDKHLLFSLSSPNGTSNIDVYRHPNDGREREAAVALSTAKFACVPEEGRRHQKPRGGGKKCITNLSARMMYNTRHEQVIWSEFQIGLDRRDWRSNAENGLHDKYA
jgi:hypothetical protein